MTDDMKTKFHFNTSAQVKWFMKTLRKSGILTERISEQEVQILSFEKIRDDMKDYVLKVSNRVYEEIM